LSHPSRWLAPLFILLAALAVLAWWYPNRLQTTAATMPGDKVNSLSFAPFRPGQSPLTDTFPTEAQAEADMALVAQRARAIRTYSAIEGDYDTAAMAARHGLKLWQGIWLGADRARNDAEIARAIAIARAHPETVERVVVGNEVLLRRDLSVEELIADIDRVRAAIPQPVTYADVQEFWEKFPEVAPHVDIVTVHLLPYWEDEPTGIDGAVAHVHDVWRAMRARFPGKPVAIGETGWPSRGRARQGAVPSRVNQAEFIRGFVALADRERFDYNLIEAFDQEWKHRDEGTVGASWGLFTPYRVAKFPLSGPVSNDPNWRRHAAVTGLVGLLLLAGALACFPRLSGAAQAKLAVTAMALGGALAYAWTNTVPDAFDLWQGIAAAGNLGGQALLAGLLMLRLGRHWSGLPAPTPHSGAHATNTVRALLTLRIPRDFRHSVKDDLMFVFLWTAALLQLLLVFDPRYRDFPLPSFAVPLVCVLARAATGSLPRGGGGREELTVGLVLVAGALASAWLEGPLNHQSLIWNAAACVLAGPPLLRVFTRARSPRPSRAPALA
jgi:exo-beta-1,3-glucanase (GH17 family)